MSLLLLTLAPLVPPAAAIHERLPERPPVFADLGWDAARTAARDGQRFLLLDAMTSWCGPCKVMDKTTWLDPAVVSWVEANAIAVQLDMDEHEALKDQLAIRAFPTMILFDAEGAEFDRIVGLREPAAMLAWLEGARGGSTERQRLVARVAELEAGSAPRIADRISLAGACASVGADAEAARLVQWLWARGAADAGEAALLERWRAFRGPSLSAELAVRVPGLRGQLSSERDRRALALEQAEQRQLRGEWIVLNDALGEDSRTLRWAAAAAASESGTQHLREHASRVFDPLVEAGMWATAGAALADPLERVRFLGENLGAYDVPQEASKPGRPRAMPAIPMGGMQPARPAQAASEEDAGQAAAPRLIPAIPMVPVAKAPGAEKEAEAQSAKPKGGAVPAIPMIPMGGAPAPARAAVPAQDDAAAVAREVRARLTHELRREASRRYGALLAAGRAAEAEAVATALLGYDDGDEARAHLVACAIRAGQMEARRGVHLRWLEEVARLR